ILHSCYRLTKLGMKDWLEWALAATAFVITVALQAEVALVFIGCGVVGLLYYGSLFRGRASASTTRVFLFGVPLAVAGAAPSSVATLLGQLLAFFLKAGSLTFGSGLVIVPFVGYLVAARLGGSLLDGFWGSLVSTIGIFLPSFLLILIVAPILVRYRANPNIQGFIKGAYAAAIGTILGACVLLGKIAIGDWLTVLVALASLVVLFRWKVSNPLLVAATAIIGLIAFPLLKPEWVFVK